MSLSKSDHGLVSFQINVGLWLWQQKGEKSSSVLCWQRPWQLERGVGRFLHRKLGVRMSLALTSILVVYTVKYRIYTYLHTVICNAMQSHMLYNILHILNRKCIYYSISQVQRIFFRGSVGFRSQILSKKSSRCPGIKQVST